MAGDLEEIRQLRLPRLIATGVDYNDVATVFGRLKKMSDWWTQWETMAEFHEKLGDEAMAAGNALTASRAWLRAAAYYQTGQAGNVADPAGKLRVQLRQQSVYDKARSHMRPPSARITVPFDGIEFAANLRLPAGTGMVPCVLLNAGADSTKEEFYTLENEFLDRGLATCSYDGPGQSTTWQKRKLRPDFEKPVGAVLDALSKHPRIDADRFGIWGRSFGGYTGPRSISLEKRLKACVSCGGFYDLGELWGPLLPGVKEVIAFGMGAKSIDEAGEWARQYTLRGVLEKLDRPMLVVHSNKDEVCPVADAERMRKAAPKHVELAIFPEGNHCCDNLPYKVRPVMADWLAAKLGAKSPG